MKLQKGFFRTKVIGGAGYSYTNTRIKAMKSKLLKKEDFQKFLKMSLPEIARYLQETEYSREITELSVKFSGANLIEYALNRNLENTFAKILGFALQHSKSQIRLYLRRYDIANIKTILRGKFSHVPDEQISNELVACGELSRAFLERAIKSSPGVEEAAEHFKNTEYYPVLTKLSGDLTRLEDELDKLYYAIVLSNAGKELAAYIRMEISVKNALNRLRAKRANIKIEIIVGEKKIAVPYEEDSVEARVFMKKLLTQRAMRMVHEVKRNVKPALGYFIAKENEIRNLRILTRGAGLGEETVHKQLVI